MDATIDIPGTISRRVPGATGDSQGATARSLGHGRGASRWPVAMAVGAALVASLALGLVDGAAGRPLGDPGPGSGPAARPGQLVLLESTRPAPGP
jgi:hypothetical protein